MKKINLLVLGVGGNVSQGILKAIHISDVDCHVIGACVSQESLGLYLCDTAYVCPYASDEEFVPWLLEVCQKEQVDLVFSGVEEIILEISKNREYIFANTTAKFVLSDDQQLKIGSDKLLTAEWLKANDCNHPLFCVSNDEFGIQELINKVGFPLIAKPRIGKGSKGVFLIKSEQELSKVRLLDDYLIQECIGDETSEYTVGCYSNRNGQQLGTIIMHRELRYGMTYKATIVKNDAIHQEAAKICSLFKPKGPLNIQLRLDKNGRPVCFELNVRFSGTTAIRAHYGYTDVEAAIKEYVMNEETNSFSEVRMGSAYRYWNEIYIDEATKEELKENGVRGQVDRTKNYVDTYGGRKL